MVEQNYERTRGVLISKTHLKFWVFLCRFRNLNLSIGLHRINAEGHPASDYRTNSAAVYCGAFSQNYGPVVSFKLYKAFYIEGFYTPGWGFRMFGDINTPTTDQIDPSEPHVNFSQALGFNMRYYGLYAGFNLQNIANRNFANGVYISNVGTIQITLGYSNWKTDK